MADALEACQSFFTVGFALHLEPLPRFRFAEATDDHDSSDSDEARKASSHLVPRIEPHQILPNQRQSCV